jgi:hypothetical protein
MTKQTAVRAAIGVALLGLIAGCAGGPAVQAPLVPAPTIGRAPASPASYLAAIIDLPWHLYIQDPRQALIVEQAELVLVVQCMRHRGYGTFTQSMMSYAVPDLAQEPGGPYGWIDGAKARKYGFHSSPADGASLHQASVRLSGAQNRALRACSASAGSTLQAGRMIDPASLVNQMAAQAWSLAAGDARVRTATARWSSCMRAHGFRYSAPPTADQWLATSRMVSRAEIATASADAACTASTDLAGIFFAVDAGYQRELIGRETAKLAAIGAELRAETARAAAVLAHASAGQARDLGTTTR